MAPPRLLVGRDALPALLTPTITGNRRPSPIHADRHRPTLRELCSRHTPTHNNPQLSGATSDKCPQGKCSTTSSDLRDREEYFALPAPHRQPLEVQDFAQPDRQIDGLHDHNINNKAGDPAEQPLRTTFKTSRRARSTRTFKFLPQ